MGPKERRSTALSSIEETACLCRTQTAPDPLVAASLPAMAWHQPAARRRIARSLRAQPSCNDPEDHSWTDGQAERMVRTIKEATVKSLHCTSINELRRHVRDWLTAYNFAKQLKARRLYRQA